MTMRERDAIERLRRGARDGDLEAACALLRACARLGEAQTLQALYDELLAHNIDIAVQAAEVAASIWRVDGRRAELLWLAERVARWDTRAAGRMAWALIDAGEPWQVRSQTPLGGRVVHDVLTLFDDERARLVSPVRVLLQPPARVRAWFALDAVEHVLELGGARAARDEFGALLEHERLVLCGQRVRDARLDVLFDVRSRARHVARSARGAAQLVARAVMMVVATRSPDSYRQAPMQAACARGAAEPGGRERELQWQRLRLLAYLLGDLTPCPDAQGTPRAS